MKECNYAVVSEIVFESIPQLCVVVVNTILMKEKTAIVIIAAAASALLLSLTVLSGMPIGSLGIHDCYSLTCLLY